MSKTPGAGSKSVIETVHTQIQWVREVNMFLRFPQAFGTHEFYVSEST